VIRRHCKAPSWLVVTSMALEAVGHTAC